MHTLSSKWHAPKKQICEFILIHTNFFRNVLKETICSASSKKWDNASITERNGLCIKLVLYCKNCETVIREYFTSPRMESTNNRQAVFVVNRKAVESTNNIHNTSFGLKLTRVVKSVMLIMTCFWQYESPGCCKHLESLRSKNRCQFIGT